jgi:hypothetical protein
MMSGLSCTQTVRCRLSPIRAGVTGIGEGADGVAGVERWADAKELAVFDLRRVVPEPAWDGARDIICFRLA